MRPILIDTSVWIKHFRSHDTDLKRVLLNEVVLMHELILGELSLGHFNKPDRKKIFELLDSLPRITTSPHEEVFQFSKKQNLQGKDVGWIDVHLLFSCWQQGVKLMTYDKKLQSLADQCI